MRRRFRAVNHPRCWPYRTVHMGTITLDDLRKKFHIPEHADVFISQGLQPNVEITNDTPIQVIWEDAR